MLSGDATGLLGVNAIGDCLDTYINIPDAFTYDGTAANNLHKYSELCGEAWAADGVATTLGPLRCESAHWCITPLVFLYLYHFQPTPHPSHSRSSPTTPHRRFW